jgi:alpha-1,2-mannosyltransferase
VLRDRTERSYRNVRDALRRPRTVLGISAVAAVYLIVLLARVQRHSNLADFSQYYVYALAMRNGQDAYKADLTSLAAKENLDIGWKHAAYTPTFILCFEPLTLLSPRMAYCVWTGMSLASLGAALFLLLYQECDLQRGLLLAAAAILYEPLALHFHFAQAQLAILLLLTLAMRSLTKGYEAVAGLALAIASLLRVFPLIFVGYLLIRRKWRALCYMGIALVLGGAITWGLLGTTRSQGFFQMVASLSHQLKVPANMSLAALISRPFWYFVEPSNPLTDLGRRIAVGLAQLAILTLTAWASTRREWTTGEDDRIFGLWVVTMVLLTPTAWSHYLVLLFLPFALLVNVAGRGEASSRAILWGIGSYVLTELSMIPADRLSWLLPQALGKGLTEITAVWVLFAFASLYYLAVDDPRSACPRSRSCG